MIILGSGLTQLAQGGGSGLPPGSVITDAQHGDRGGGALHPVVTGSTAGFMSPFQLNTLQAASTGASLALSQIAGGIASTRLGLAIARAVSKLGLTQGEMSRAIICDWSRGGFLGMTTQTIGALSVAPVSDGSMWNATLSPASSYNQFDYTRAFGVNAEPKWYVEADVQIAGTAASGQACGVGFYSGPGAPTVGVGIHWSPSHLAWYVGSLGMTDPVDIRIPGSGIVPIGCYRNGASTGVSADLSTWHVQGLNGWDAALLLGYVSLGAGNSSASTFLFGVRNLFAMLVTTI